MRHYGPKYAVMLARLIGYRQPLVRRLRDPEVEKTQDELDYVAGVLADDGAKWPTRKQVIESRKKLRRAVTFLRLHIVNGHPKKKAKGLAAEQHRTSRDYTSSKRARPGVRREPGVTPRTIEEALRFAKKLGDGEWWAGTSRLARKARTDKYKLAQLMRTY
jgi:hypothetical protein